MTNIAIPHRSEESELPGAVARRSVASHTIPGMFELLEETAYDLAVLAGERIIDTLGRQISVRYKDDQRGIMAPFDAVSDVDEEIEALIRRRLAARHPDHAVIGEEGGLGGAAGAAFTWTIDPIDGTTNFVNGLPFYASSVGVLLDGVPVAGAVWSATTHALRPGVYHARSGGELRFEGRILNSRRTAVGRRRRVSTAPAPHKQREPHWDHRHLGAIAVESALVAAGILASARALRPRVWDVAAGVVLTQAAGHEVWTHGRDRWEPFTTFGEDPAQWAQAMIFGDEDAVTALRVGALAI